MMLCQSCGQLNEIGQNYCRHCGAALVLPQREITTPPVQPPKPYSWASPSSPLHQFGDDENFQEPQRAALLAPPTYQPPPVFNSAANSSLAQTNFIGYRCPRCGTNAAPIAMSKISDGGWVVFVLMLFFCLPLFFIGLLMRDQYRVCPICLLRIG